jgi:hypothetical protein
MTGASQCLGGGGGRIVCVSSVDVGERASFFVSGRTEKMSSVDLKWFRTTQRS